MRDRWELYDRPGLLIGPVPYKRAPSGAWVPVWSSPGARERLNAEIDYVCDMQGRQG